MKVTYLNTQNGVVIDPTSQLKLKRVKRARFLQPAIIDKNLTIQKAISPKKKGFYVVNLFNKLYIVFENVKTCFRYIRDDLYLSPQDFKEFHNKKNLTRYISNH